MTALRKLVITPGDPDGIGPEVVWKSIRGNFSRWKKTHLLCVGARKPFERLRARIVRADSTRLEYPREKKPFIWLLEAPHESPAETLLEGYQSGWSIEKAVSLVRTGDFHALVTGPIHKGRLNQGGFRFSGHTDFLANLAGLHASDVTMMLANEKLRVSLVTTHLPLSTVSGKLTSENIARAARNTLHALNQWWGLKKPKIAVCALNPHAGEGGLFGSEETQTITPTISRLREEWGNRASISGPYPSDTFFALHVQESKSRRADAVICMYHDQGLIPVKLIDFPRTVNVTLGLPFIRTSVDHGTGFDIVGKNQADPRSFQSAVDLALQLIQKRKK